MTEQQIEALRQQLNIRTIDSMTKWMVIQALGLCHGNVQRTALVLDVGRGTLYRWMQEWNITRKGEIK